MSYMDAEKDAIKRILSDLVLDACRRSHLPLALHLNPVDANRIGSNTFAGVQVVSDPMVPEGRPSVRTKGPPSQSPVGDVWYVVAALLAVAVVQFLWWLLGGFG